MCLKGEKVPPFCEKCLHHAVDVRAKVGFSYGEPAYPARLAHGGGFCGDSEVALPAEKARNGAQIVSCGTIICFFGGIAVPLRPKLQQTQ